MASCAGGQGLIPPPAKAKKCKIQAIFCSPSQPKEVEMQPDMIIWVIYHLHVGAIMPIPALPSMVKHSVSARNRKKVFKYLFFSLQV